MSMATNTYYGLLLMAVLAYIPGKAQDIIYTVQQQAFHAKITEISEATIKYEAPESPGETKEMDPMKVALAFNARGDYLVFNSGNAVNPASAKNFLNRKVSRPCDIIFTVDSRVLPAVIEKENE